MRKSFVKIREVSELLVEIQCLYCIIKTQTDVTALITILFLIQAPC